MLIKQFPTTFIRVFITLILLLCSQCNSSTHQFDSETGSEIWLETTDENSTDAPRDFRGENMTTFLQRAANLRATAIASDGNVNGTPETTIIGKSKTDDIEIWPESSTTCTSEPLPVVSESTNTLESIPELVDESPRSPRDVDVAQTHEGKRKFQIRNLSDVCKLFTLNSKRFEKKETICCSFFSGSMCPTHAKNVARWIVLLLGAEMLFLWLLWKSLNTKVIVGMVLFFNILPMLMVVFACMVKRLCDWHVRRFELQ